MAKSEDNYYIENVRYNGELLMLNGKPVQGKLVCANSYNKRGLFYYFIDGRQLKNVEGLPVVKLGTLNENNEIEAEPYSPPEPEPVTKTQIIEKIIKVFIVLVMMVALIYFSDNLFALFALMLITPFLMKIKT